MKTQITKPQIAALALKFVFMLTVVVTQATQAQTFKVLHDFAAGPDGSSPTGGLTMDSQGNLYGVTAFGGINCGFQGCGTVFRLKKSNTNWTLDTLYTFTGGFDGSEPLAPVVFGPDLSLYGTASSISTLRPGTVFNLTPGSLPSFLYAFTGGTDGDNPGWGPVVFKGANTLYGTTTRGVTSCGGPTCGNVYQMTRLGSGWIEFPIYTFTGGTDGGQPFGSVILGNGGHLFGVTSQGGTYGAGAVYELIPSGSSWTEHILYNFQGGSDGGSPLGGLVFDHLGNLYGTTAQNGSGGGGTVFKLSPSSPYWTLTSLHSFTGTEGSDNALTMDEAGNLYGTTYTDGAFGFGSVFKLAHDSAYSVSGWTFSTLHDFTGGSDGYLASGSLVVDSKGYIYGETWAGSTSAGVIFEITP